MTHNLCSNFHRELQKNVNLHFKVHTMRSIKRFPHKCPISKCHSSFASANELKKHLQIHNNDLRQCQYCAFRYVREDNYKIHLKVQGFNNFDQCWVRLPGVHLVRISHGTERRPSEIGAPLYKKYKPKIRVILE